MLRQNIKTLYQKIDNKSDFIEFSSAYFSKSFNTVKNHWLCKFGGWSVPEKHQAEMVKLLQNWNKQQTNKQ